ncbi:MAG: CVNH domain-containing protein [Azoarcus sp.]|nr:CVNH domain-containing protein [Azoarcus sp.]
MKLYVAFVSGLLALAATYTPLALADVPGGSYRQTCSSIRQEGENLTATCKRFDGSSKTSTLAFATSCVGNISNVDGNLACTGPVGSFARTCRNTRVEGDTVYSTCQRKDGSWKETRSTFSGFQHPLTNCDGDLVDDPVCK